METIYNKFSEITIIISLIIVIFLYLVGVCLHIKIIIVSNKEKSITWKLDVTNSAVLLFNGMHAVLCIALHISWIIFMSTLGNGFALPPK